MVHISKQGVCIATSGSWETGGKIWIQKSGNQMRTIARAAWVKKVEQSQFLMQLDILDCEDFWT